MKFAYKEGKLGTRDLRDCTIATSLDVVLGKTLAGVSGVLIQINHDDIKKPVVVPFLNQQDAETFYTELGHMIAEAWPQAKQSQSNN